MNFMYLIKQDFSSFTSKNTNNFIKNSIICFNANSNNYVPIGLSKTIFLEKNNVQFETVEFIPFDEMALFELFH